MIEQGTGNLLKADAEALVNTVNTVDVMGKGIALQFRQAFPQNYEAYRKACQQGEVTQGRMFVTSTWQLTNPRYIINFPTKRDWRSRSRLEDIEAGLTDLIAVLRQHAISSIAIPPLGCGNGGLNWNEVRLLIEAAFATLPDVRVLLYAPEGAPEAESMQVATKQPRMTLGRAVLIGLFECYAQPDYRLSMLEIQKLAYLMQAAGEPLKLQFAKAEYGPYSETLHPALQNIEGHFIRGYGDRSRGASVRLMPDAARKAKDFLEDHPATGERIERVAHLIEGFETPYGMELLATVHWLAHENPAYNASVDSMLAGVHAWNARKRATFRPEHIEIVWNRLREQSWI